MADERVAEVRRLIDGLRRAADAVPLARRAVERITDAMLQMDDSSGIIGGDLRILTALYARACRAAPPDPKQLAAWLVTALLCRIGGALATG